MNPFLQGILLGLTITVSIGPGFMALFQTSIMQGVKSGFILAFGILLGDLLLISISYFGIGNISSKGNYLIMGIIAGIILIITGGLSLFKKDIISLNNSNQLINFKNNLSLLLLKGFLLNISNPFCLVFWIGILGFAASRYGIHSNGFFIFFSGLLMTAFTSDLLKCYLSGFLRKILTTNIIQIINKTVGAILIIIGLFIIHKVVS